MTLIDSVDSIIMLYAYAGFPDRKLGLLEAPPAEQSPQVTQQLMDPESSILPGNRTPSVVENATPVNERDGTKTPSPLDSLQELPRSRAASPPLPDDIASLKALTDDNILNERDEEIKRQLRVKRNAMSGLSIVLTLMSILVAFTFVPCFSPFPYVS